MAEKKIIRTSRKAVWLGTCAGWIIRLWTSTLRIRVNDLCGITQRENFQDQPVIYALWHNRIFTLPALFRRFCPWRQATALISGSKDGAALEAAFKALNISAARGSSSRGGAAALIALRKALRRGEDTGITPDGPKGPLYEIKPGLLKLAETSGAPIIPLHLTFSRVITLNTWDHFIIPLPFSRVEITFDHPLYIEKGISDEEQVIATKNIRDTLLSHVDTPPISP